MEWLELETMYDLRHEYTEEQLSDPEYLSSLEKELSQIKRDTSFRDWIASSVNDVHQSRLAIKKLIDRLIHSEKLDELQVKLSKLNQKEFPFVPKTKKLQKKKVALQSHIIHEKKRIIINILKEVEKNPSPELSILHNLFDAGSQDSIRQKMSDEIMRMLEQELSK